MGKKGQRIIDGVFLMTGPFVSQIRLKIKFTAIILILEILCQLSSPFIIRTLNDFSINVIMFAWMYLFVRVGSTVWSVT